jgi:hypothetical protein
MLAFTEHTQWFPQYAQALKVREHSRGREVQKILSYPFTYPNHLKYVAVVLKTPSKF